MNESFIFYKSFYEATQDLTDEQLGRVMRAIAEYGLNEVVLEGMDPITKMAFTLIKPQLDANLRRRANGAKGGRPTTETKPNNNLDVTETKPNGNLDETKAEPNVNVNVNINNIKEKDSKESKKKSFAPPSVEEVREYCNERGNNVDPDKFVDYYTCKGWVVGRSKMKDWKAAVRTWEQRERAAPAKVDVFDAWLKAKERGDDVIGISANQINT